MFLSNIPKKIVKSILDFERSEEFIGFIRNFFFFIYTWKLYIHLTESFTHYVERAVIWHILYLREV